MDNSSTRLSSTKFLVIYQLELPHQRLKHHSVVQKKKKKKKKEKKTIHP